MGFRIVPTIYPRWSFVVDLSSPKIELPQKDTITRLEKRNQNWRLRVARREVFEEYGKGRIEYLAEQARVINEGFATLRTILGLPNSGTDTINPRLFNEEWRDVILVSIDIEGHDDESLREVGVSTLDMRDLHHPTNTKNAIKSENHRFRYRPFYSRSSGEYNFLFGRTQRYSEVFKVSSKEERKQMINDLLTNIFQRRPSRNLGLVGHNIHQDMKVMGYFGFDVKKCPSVVGCLDTQFLADAWNKPHNVYPEQRCSPLKSLLEIYNIPHMFLHLGGNDARFTLELLLALAVKTTSIAQEELPWAPERLEQWEMETYHTQQKTALRKAFQQCLKEDWMDEFEYETNDDEKGIFGYTFFTGLD